MNNAYNKMVKITQEQESKLYDWFTSKFELKGFKITKRSNWNFLKLIQTTILMDYKLILISQIMVHIFKK